MGLLIIARKHNACYGTCNQYKKNCDLEFCSDMLQTCKKQPKKAASSLQIFFVLESAVYLELVRLKRSKMNFVVAHKPEIEIEILFSKINNIKIIIKS